MNHALALVDLSLGHDLLVVNKLFIDLLNGALLTEVKWQPVREFFAINCVANLVLCEGFHAE